jgi:hypothetical protein
MDREVQLPHTTNNDITEVLDVSPIYIFYDETKPDSVDFNRRNMISTTNWLVNIDKRLTLKQVLPHLQYLQEKRHGDGMHKNKNAKNYFTCFNPETENLSFIEFTNVKFETSNIENDTFYTNNVLTKDDHRLMASYHSYSNLPLVFNKNDNIKLGFQNITINQLKDKISFYLEEYNFIGFIIYPYFHEKLTLKEYIIYKTALLELEFENVEIDDNEFIIN